MTGSEQKISIIVPALNEAANLPELARRIDAAMAGSRYELIIVDDNSADGTAGVCEGLSLRYPLRLEIRRQPVNGLSGAVLRGFDLAGGEIFVVMDADLQHPPESLPDLLAPLRDGRADFVLGSRYVPGGTTEGRWGALRKINSRVATFLARPFSGSTHDPMSGYFALSRQTYAQAQQLTPLGYKVGLELMCKSRARRIVEVPIRFGTRQHGQSKLTVSQQFKYLEHLSRLYDFYYSRGSPAAKFLISAGIGWFVAFSLYALLVSNDINPVLAPCLAYPAAVATTLVFHARYVRTQRDFLVTRRPWLDFALIALAEWSACTLSAKWVAYRVVHASAAEVFVLSFGCATLVRYVFRKELLQDIRGLRHQARPAGMTGQRMSA